jgi:hypothetical protein
MWRERKVGWAGTWQTELRVREKTAVFPRRIHDEISANNDGDYEVWDVGSMYNRSVRYY